MIRLFDVRLPGGKATVALGYAALVAAFLLAYAQMFADVNPIVPDSRGYLHFSPDRSIGYQLFLALLGQLSSTVAIVRVAQLLIVGISVLLAAYALFRRTGSALTGAALVILTLGYPAPMKTAVQVTTEGLSMACTALFAAIYLADARRRRRWAMPVMAVLLLVATTIRPTNPSLLIGALLALWLCGRREGWRAPLLLVASVLLGMAASPLAHGWLAPGREGDSAGTRGLFGAALLAPGAGDAEARHCAAPAFDAELTPVTRYLAAAPDRIAGYLTVHYTNYLRFDRTIPQIMAERGLRWRAEANPVMLCYAKARLARHPGYVVERSARNYWSLVSYENYDQPAFVRRLERYLSANPPPLPAPIAFPDDPDAGLRRTTAWKTGDSSPSAVRAQAPAQPRNPLVAKDARNVWLTRILSGVLLVSTALGLLALLAAPFARWRTPAVVDMAVFAIVTQAVLVVSAIVEIPLMRYLYPVWPLIALVLVRAFSEILSRWVPSRRAHSGAVTDLR